MGSNPRSASVSGTVFYGGKVGGGLMSGWRVDFVAGGVVLDMVRSIKRTDAG